MAANDKKRIRVLNDLICINNNRIAGYERIVHLLQGSVYEQINPIFVQKIHESRVFVYQLSAVIMRLRGHPMDGTTIFWKCFGIWLTLKELFMRAKLKSLLEICEFIDGITWKTYDKALALEIWEGATSLLLTSHWQAIKNSFQAMKQYSIELKHMRVQNV